MLKRIAVKTLARLPAVVKHGAAQAQQGRKQGMGVQAFAQKGRDSQAPARGGKRR